MTANDNELLRAYVREQSESAFAELVQRHIRLVYSAALRQLNGDRPAAEDVVQGVFSDLARKAPRLLGHTSLTGWLYTSTRFEAGRATGSWRGYLSTSNRMRRGISFCLESHRGAWRYL